MGIALKTTVANVFKTVVPPKGLFPNLLIGKLERVQSLQCPNRPAAATNLTKAAAKLHRGETPMGTKIAIAVIIALLILLIWGCASTATGHQKANHQLFTEQELAVIESDLHASKKE